MEREAGTSDRASASTLTATGGSMSEPALFETMYNCRAIRQLKPDPVPDELIHKILDAAIRAPSGSNRQSWHFLVVRDAATKRTLQGYYKQAFDMYRTMMANVP